MTKLEKFLINRNLLESFEYNVINHSLNRYTFRYFLKNGNVNNIGWAFVWKRTDEGCEFWEKIYYEFEKCLKNEII